MAEEKNMNKKEIGELFKALTLFFILTVVSIVMIYSKFEQGVEDFWKNEQNSTVVSEMGVNEEKSK